MVTRTRLNIMFISILHVLFVFSFGFFLIPIRLSFLQIKKERTKMGKDMPKENFCNVKDTKLL